MSLSQGKKKFNYNNFVCNLIDNKYIYIYFPLASIEYQNSQFDMIRKDMSNYFRDVIKDRGISDLQSTRDQIVRCFEQGNNNVYD